MGTRGDCIGRCRLLLIGAAAFGVASLERLIHHEFHRCEGSKCCISPKVVVLGSCTTYSYYFFIFADYW
jgi:hypothetical protein